MSRHRRSAEQRFVSRHGRHGERIKGYSSHTKERGEAKFSHFLSFSFAAIIIIILISAVLLMHRVFVDSFSQIDSHLSSRPTKLDLEELIVLEPTKGKAKQRKMPKLTPPRSVKKLRHTFLAGPCPHSQSGGKPC
jgi:hypothetical protein